MAVVIHVYTSVCVCEREREREGGREVGREGGRDGGREGERERERERERDLMRKGQAISMARASWMNLTPAGENGGQVQVMRLRMTAVSSLVRYI